MLRPFDLIMTWEIKYFDILFFVAKLISWITGGGPSHVRVWCKGLYKDYDFWEVTWPKCRFGYMSEVDPKYYRIEYGRHCLLPYPLPNELKEKGLETMLKLEGTLYDVGELAFSQFFDEIGLDHSDQSDPQKFVCSSGAEYVLKSMGFPFCILDQLASPQDIRRSDYYAKIRKKDTV